MAYKQPPFPMIEGTSPVKQLGLLKYGVKYGKKLYKYSKKVIKKYSGKSYEGKEGLNLTRQEKKILKESGRIIKN